MVQRRCWGAQLEKLWQYRTPREGCTGCGARNCNDPTGGRA